MIGGPGEVGEEGVCTILVGDRYLVGGISIDESLVSLNRFKKLHRISHIFLP